MPFKYIYTDKKRLKKKVFVLFYRAALPLSVYENEQIQKRINGKQFDPLYFTTTPLNIPY